MDPVFSSHYKITLAHYSMIKLL